MAHKQQNLDSESAVRPNIRQGGARSSASLAQGQLLERIGGIRTALQQSSSHMVVLLPWGRRVEILVLSGNPSLKPYPPDATEAGATPACAETTSDAQSASACSHVFRISSCSCWFTPALPLSAWPSRHPPARSSGICGHAAAARGRHCPRPKCTTRHTATADVWRPACQP